MKKKEILLSAALLAGVISFAGGKEDKVNVRHNGKVISISANALAAHLAHGDEEVFQGEDGEWYTASEYQQYQEATVDDEEAEGENEDEEEEEMQ